jgi:hypothetical protein
MAPIQWLRSIYLGCHQMCGLESLSGLRNSTRIALPIIWVAPSLCPECSCLVLCPEGYDLCSGAASSGNFRYSLRGPSLWAWVLDEFSLGIPTALLHCSNFSLENQSQQTLLTIPKRDGGREVEKSGSDARYKKAKIYNISSTWDVCSQHDEPIIYIIRNLDSGRNLSSSSFIVPICEAARNWWKWQIRVWRNDRFVALCIR